jgi:hypothetical protein
MKISRLVEALSNRPAGVPVILDFGGAHYGVSKVGYLTGDDNVVIIEAGDGRITTGGLLAQLLNFPPNSEVQLFATMGEDYGYYNVSTTFYMFNDMTWLLAGSLIMGGV